VSLRTPPASTIADHFSLDHRAGPWGVPGTSVPAPPPSTAAGVLSVLTELGGLRVRRWRRLVAMVASLAVVTLAAGPIA